MFKNRWKVLGITLVTVMTVFALVIPVIASEFPITKIAPSVILAQATNETDVDAIASMTTVFISENVEKKEDINNSVRNGQIFQYAGSGVIVGRREQIIDAATYKGGVKNGIKQFVHYVITNAHVVEQLINDKDVPYGLRTYDGEVYTVQDVEFIGNPKNENNIDLAVFEFVTEKPYPVATINTSAINTGERLFVSGWPTPSQKNTIRKRRFTSAQLERQNPLEPIGNYGYNLVYSATAPGVRVGMSGGPIFNSKGEVVGIHSGGPPDSNSQGNDQKDLLEGRGIQIIQLLRKKQANNFNIAPPSVSSELIAQGRERPGQADSITSEDFAEGFVSPTDRAFQAFQSLRERYGCMRDTIRQGLVPSSIEVSRGRVALDLNDCLQSVETLISEASRSKKIKEIEQKINRLEQTIKFLQ
ncbi:trypsin-like peptidase domain-containing protein [Sphaerospermopsis kisseleviana CS-549]|uniref:Serine protease n=2 Tax=Sphaerospermopsis TaxID=752201 RepID=A0ABR9VJV4_9CYAN|nr:MULTISPECIES: serine protease [Sphaerospermopsis]MBE9238791.1 trypsin-like peptidase domain-containing protein [Sphaerospermopsis aphanizomenoides LEGE 00250]MDB9443834.1 trypsin-like peptidase domain-containing protein [Sphaerospermopsis kisseleviana CS-549]BAZ80139.1 putative serine protease [Sphaerospermopsis kisseleviana NIES-73]